MCRLFISAADTERHHSAAPSGKVPLCGCNRLGYIPAVGVHRERLPLTEGRVPWGSSG